MTLGRGHLAAALAAVMVVVPSLAPAQEKPGAKSTEPAKLAQTFKPANDPKVTQPPEKLTLLEQVGNYSEQHPVVVIGVAKGQKEKLLTGEQIGETLSEVLKKKYGGTPSKYFVEPGGDYTAIIFAVDGHVYGPYGLKDSLVAIGVPADNYSSKVRRGIFPPPDSSASTGASNPMGGVAAKPEPQQ